MRLHRPLHRALSAVLLMSSMTCWSQSTSNPTGDSKPAASTPTPASATTGGTETAKPQGRVVPVYVLRDERDRFSSRGARIALNGVVEGELMPGQFFRIDSEAKGSELVADANLSLGQCKVKLDLSNSGTDSAYVEVRARLEAVRAESSSKKIGNLIGFAGIGSVVGNVVSVVGGQVSNVTDTSGCTGSFELVEIPKAYAEEKMRRMAEPPKSSEPTDSKTGNNP